VSTATSASRQTDNRTPRAPDHVSESSPPKWVSAFQSRLRQGALPEAASSEVVYEFFAGERRGPLCQDHVRQLKFRGSQQRA
jgi:hypothetical protein